MHGRDLQWGVQTERETRSISRFLNPPQSSLARGQHLAH